jgi:acetolactate synthase-1/2/3 large subunit
MDSTPLVVLTGQVTMDSIGRDAFQEADIMGITMPVTKHNYQIRDVNDLPQVIADAFHIANSGRPGPVLIDLPKNITAGAATYQPLPTPNARGYKIPSVPSTVQVDAIVEAIKQAKKPLLYVGGGIVSAGAADVLWQFAHKTQIPVVATLMGLGAYPSGDELFFGMLGMHGKYSANKAVSECDLLLAFGVRFDDRVTGRLELFSQHSKKVHVDIDPAEIGKNVPIDIPVIANIKDTLEMLVTYDLHPDTADWRAQVNAWDEEWPLRYHGTDVDLKPQQVVELLAKHTNGQAIVTTEVGQHQMWAALFYPFSRPRQLVTSGGLGTMGFGFPSALGAQVAQPHHTVICVAGDASFQMNIQELQTMVDQGLPVKVAIINNRFLGMVRQWQQFFYEKRYAESRVSSPDFVKVAEAYGVLGLRATTPVEAEAVIAQAMAYDGPVVMDFVVKEEENVFPMVPPGKGNHEMTLEWGVE